MPRISTGPFGTASKTITCTVCGQAFLRLSDLSRHQKLHDPTAVRFQCPYETCGYSSLQKANVETHINSRHIRNNQYSCRFDSSCPKSYTDRSSRVRHEKTEHGYSHKLHKDVIREAERRDDDSSATLVPDIVITEWESSTRAPSESVSFSGDDPSERIKELAIDSPCPTPHSPLRTSFGDLQLNALQPMSAGFARRPTLPGVESILARCPDEGAFDYGNQGSNVPPLVDPPNKRFDSTASRQGATQERLEPQLVHGSFEGEAKLARLGKEYLVSFRMSIKENNH